MRSKIPSRVLTETGSCLPGVSESIHMLPCGGITREPGAPPGLGRQTDLDFLLVMVDLPGDVHVHRTPLPWFLQRETATWSGDLSEKTAFISPNLSRFGLRRLFHETTVLSTPVPLPAARQCPGRRPWSAPSPPTGAGAGRLLRTPHLVRTSHHPGQVGKRPRPTLCLCSLSVRCQLADLGAGEPCLTNVAVLMQTGRSKSSLVPGNHSEQGRVQTPVTLPAPALLNPPSKTKEVHTVS